ncbi:MAG: 1-acyl-sn-glycerol-3-phosphate acyltransferase [Candidatus Omnitrophica bacterium]|nr:1-acyl-sn-glycerol-3-phosphate acyltransferase [Candidatus Omnitrophota bacterium]
MKAVLSILIWLGVAALTILVFLVDLLLVIILFPFDKKRRMLHVQSFWWSDAIIGLNPYWDLTVRGLENIEPQKTYVIVANHQSLADIIIMYKTRMQFRWVAKESLFKVPFIGWCLSLGKHIRLARGRYASIKKVYRQAATWLRKDISVAFFPEGTRSSSDEMNKFQNGAFKLAIKEKKPVLPIAMNGTRDAIPKGSWIFTRKVSGTITVLQPIETKDFRPADFIRLRDIVHARLQDATKANSPT